MEITMETVFGFMKTFGVRLLLACAILVLGSLITRFLKKRLPESRILERLDVSTANFLKNTLLIAVRVVIVITILITLGMPATSFVTILASAGVTVGLALQGSLSNLAGGIMIMFFRPYSVGDTIKAMNMEGTVKEISAFYTTLVTPDNSRVVLPNGSLNNSVIVNYSAEKTRRIEISLNAPKTEAYELQTAKIQKCLKEHPLLLDRECKILLIKETAEAYSVRIYAWCNAKDYENVLLTLENMLSHALTA